MTGDANQVLVYAERELSRGRATLPGWLSIVSLIPLPLLVVVLWTADVWGRWFNLGQGWERVAGTIWIGTAALSVVWLIVFTMRPKRWHGWVTVGLHLILIAVTLLPPGCIGLAWLMHWTSGPGS